MKITISVVRSKGAMLPEGSDSCPLLFCFALFVARFFTLIFRLPLRSTLDVFPFCVFPLGICPLSLSCLVFISFWFLGLDGEEAIETPLLFCIEEFLELLGTFSYAFFAVIDVYLSMNKSAK